MTQAGSGVIKAIRSVYSLLLFRLQLEKLGYKMQQGKKWKAEERDDIDILYIHQWVILLLFSFSLLTPVIEVRASLGSEISNLKRSVEPCASHLQQSLKL